MPWEPNMPAMPHIIYGLLSIGARIADLRPAAAKPSRTRVEGNKASWTAAGSEAPRRFRTNRSLWWFVGVSPARKCLCRCAAGAIQGASVTLSISTHQKVRECYRPFLDNPYRRPHPRLRGQKIREMRGDISEFEHCCGSQSRAPKKEMDRILLLVRSHRQAHFSAIAASLCPALAPATTAGGPAIKA